MHVLHGVGIFVVYIVGWYWRRKGRYYLDKISQPQHHPQCTANNDRLTAKLEFLERVGNRYGYSKSKKGFIDHWRPSEFPSLIRPLILQSQSHVAHHKQNKQNSSEQTKMPRPTQEHNNPEEELEVYLDYAGSAIPTRSLLTRISNTSAQILANPHSLGGGLASDRTIKLMQLSKDCVMQHFGIEHESFGLQELDNSDDGAGNRNDVNPGYQLVFTSGATESLRLTAERFSWSSTKITATQNSYIALSHSSKTVQYRQSPNKETVTHTTKQIKSIQAKSILLYPRNVHTSVIGMRQVAMQRGAIFHCASVDELLDATSEWFQSLIEESMSYEECIMDEEKLHFHTSAHHVDDEEKKDEYNVHDTSRCVGQVNNPMEDALSCKTIYLHHLIVLPV